MIARVHPRAPISPDRETAVIDVASAMRHPRMFLPWFKGNSWDNWQTVLKATAALPMNATEREFFHSIAGRDPPAAPVREAWLIAGRGAGKDSVASEIAAFMAATFKPDRLRRGERVLVMCLACDRDQAKIVLNYIRSYFENIAPLKDMVIRETSDGLQLNNQCDIVVATNSYRSVRGRGILCAILDEVAFYRDDRSANPDEELYAAIMPGLARVPNSILIGISTPYRRAGLLFKKFSKHYGQDSDILVIRAPSIVLNPTLDQSIIDKALGEDPSLASAEWLAEWRTDIESFVSREAVAACVVPGRHELPPLKGVRYVAFVDPAGGSGSDSMTLAIAHKDSSGRVILDCVRERRPSFSPAAVVDDFATLALSYNVTKIIGDHWGGEFVREPFRSHGLPYELADRPKSDFYRDVLPAINSGDLELLDHPRMTSQLCGLERRTARSGKDSIDHPPHSHDDLINAVAGACVLAVSAKKPMRISAEVLAWAGTRGPWRPSGPQGSRSAEAIDWAGKLRAAGHDDETITSLTGEIVDA